MPTPGYAQTPGEHLSIETTDTSTIPITKFVANDHDEHNLSQAFPRSVDAINVP